LVTSGKIVIEEKKLYPSIGMDKPVKILVVEDNFEHLRLTRYILKRNGVPGELFVVRDGQEAIDFLYQRNQYADRSQHPRPNLVLLDFNIPRVDGKQVLQIMKGDDGLKDIPVVVVSSSNRPEDVAFATENGATAYISKSSGFEKLSEALASVHRFASPQSDK
jgi:CheY-like chemotaxis protein